MQLVYRIFSRFQKNNYVLNFREVWNFEKDFHIYNYAKTAISL